MKKQHIIKRRKEAKQEIAKQLHSQEADRKQYFPKLQPLITIEDLVKIEELSEGYVVVRNSAVKINGKWHDLAVSSDVEPKKRRKFYNIPILSVSSEEDSEIFAKVRDINEETSFPRYFIWTPENKKPYLVELILGRFFSYADYTATNYQLLSRSLEGRRLFNYAKGLGKRLSSRF